MMVTLAHGLISSLVDSVLTMSGTATIGQYQSVLRTLK